MSYTDAEKQEFRDKDLRISRLAIEKSLIEKLPLEDIYGVTKVIELTEKYVDHVYSERKESSKGGQVSCEAKLTISAVANNAEHEPNWEQVAIGLNLAIPNSQNIKILNQVVSEYKKAYKASANPKDVLTCCINRFGTYPTKSSSAEKVVKSLLKG